MAASTQAPLRPRSARSVNKANTSATVASSVNPSVYGQTVTFTATVSVVSPGSTAVAYPTGTVTFYDGGTSIGTGTLSVVSGQDQATLGTSTLGHGHRFDYRGLYQRRRQFQREPGLYGDQPGREQGQHHVDCGRFACLRQPWPDRYVYRDGHSQLTGLGHANGHRRLLRYHDQHRPDARRRCAVVGHGDILNDEPRGGPAHHQGDILGRRQLPHQLWHREHCDDRPDDLRPRSLGRRGAQPLGQREHQHLGGRLRRLQLVVRPIGQRRSIDQGVWSSTCTAGCRRAAARRSARRRSPARPWSPIRSPRCHCRALPD